MSVIFCDGIPVTQNNVISDDKKTHYISYLRFSSDYGSDTTCLYIHETSQHLILNGDHHSEMSGLELDEVVKYFYSQIEKANFRSEHGKVFTYVDGKFNYFDGGY